MSHQNGLTSQAKLVQNKGLIGIILSTFWKILKILRQFSFAFYYPILINAFYNARTALFKEDAYASIHMIVPSDIHDRRLKILEIGSGPGCNFDYFPKKCRYTALDKNGHFKNVLLKNLKKHPGIFLEDYLNECGENMSSVPSNSVDVVLSSSVHCSVDNSQEVLKEINRVLVPGGRYYFLEHVLDKRTSLRYKLQTAVNKTGLWQLFGHGCTFVNFEEEISKSNLFKYHGKHYVFPNNAWTSYLVYLVASQFGGYAQKAK